MAVGLIEVILLEGAVGTAADNMPFMDQITAIADIALAILIPEIRLITAGVAFVAGGPFGLLFGLVLFEDGFL